MGRRSEHSREELQNLIIDATLSLVQDQGADKVTARQIAAAVGYTPGMLYSVFTNLQDIFLHVNARSLDTLRATCTDALGTTSDPEESIRVIGLAYLQFAEQHTHQFDLLFNQKPVSDKKLPEALTTNIDSLFSMIETQLGTLRQKNGGKHSTSEKEAETQLIRTGARALWSGVHGVAQLSLSGQLFDESPDLDREIVEMLINHFLDSWKRQEITPPQAPSTDGMQHRVLLPDAPA